MAESISIEAIDREINSVLAQLKSMDDEARDYIRPLLRESVLETMRPEAAVLEHIRANHEIVRGYSFPEGSGDDEAMFLLQYQVVIGKGYLRSILEDEDPVCEHRPRMTSGPHPIPLFTIQERAANGARDVQKHLLTAPSVAETNPQIEAAVAQQMAPLDGIEDEIRVQLEEAFRSRILSTRDPLMVIRRRLSKYENEQGILEIPEKQRLDQALKLLLLLRDLSLAALNLIASSKLSCGDHHVIYAGEVESEGNRIFTAQKVAENALNDLEGYLLEPKPVRDVLRKLLTELTSESYS